MITKLKISRMVSMALFIAIVAFGSIIIGTPIALMSGYDISKFIGSLLVSFPIMVAYVKLAGPFMAVLLFHATGVDEE